MSHTFFSHPRDGGLETFFHDSAHDLGRGDRGRGIYTHATSVRPGVTLTDTLVVLSRRQRNDGVAVRECEDGNLGAYKEFLNNNLAAWCDRKVV